MEIELVLRTKYEIRSTKSTNTRTSVLLGALGLRGDSSEGRPCVHLRSLRHDFERESMMSRNLHQSKKIRDLITKKPNSQNVFLCLAVQTKNVFRCSIWWFPPSS